MKKWMLLTVVLAGAPMACSDSTSDPEVDPERTQSSCSSAKCDGTDIPPLQALSDIFGSCDLDTVDESSDVHLNCELVSLHEAAPIRIEGGSVWVEFADGERTEPVWFEEEELNGDAKLVAQWDENAAYPIVVRVLPVAMLRDRDSGMLDNPVDNWKPMAPEITFSVEEAPESEEEYLLVTPTQFWSVVIWPTAEFAELWNDDSLEGVDTIEKMSVEIEGTFQGSFGVHEYSYGRTVNRGMVVNPLPDHVFHLPVDESSSPRVEVKFNTTHDAGSAEIERPGYYLVEKDGSIRLSNADEVLERGMSKRLNPASK